MKKAIVYSGSSDIGYELCKSLIEKGYKVFATYNTYSDKVGELSSIGVEIFKFNLQSNRDIDDSVETLLKNFDNWDLLVLLQATMNPIGKLTDIDFDEWEKSIELNFTKQVRIINHLLKFRNSNSSVITFAGGGTNNATSHYSAYTISKIALIKMMELLYEEYSDTKFTCIGPGWVDTKIHQETIKAKELAKDTYDKTIARYRSNEFTKIKTIIECIFWIISEKIDVVSGRNFSVANDLWSKEELSDKLLCDKNMYKLRREGNSWKV